MVIGKEKTPHCGFAKIENHTVTSTLMTFRSYQFFFIFTFSMRFSNVSLVYVRYPLCQHNDNTLYNRRALQPTKTPDTP